MVNSLRVSEAFAIHRRERLRAERWSLKTEEAYDNTCLLLINKFGDINILDFTYDHALIWSEWLFGWQSQNTVKNNVSCLRMVLKFLKVKKQYDVMNYEEIPVPKRPKQKINYLTAQEVREFILEASKKIRGYSKLSRLQNVAIMELLFSSGLRNSELCALNRDTIRNRQFTVVGKSKEERLVFINERAEKAIATYLEERRDTNPALFISPNSGKRLKPKALGEIFRTVCARSTKFKKVTPHTMRHSYGTDLLENEVDLRYIGDLMGHQSLDTTKIYTHYTNPKLKAIYDKAKNSASLALT